MNTIHTRNTIFVDDTGRQRIFNGVNIVYKDCAEDDDGVIRYKTPITDEVMAKLAKKGINIIRLGVTWAGIEPEPGVYNTEYLDGVKNALKICEKYGVYAYVDWHQDLYTKSNINVGDGAPSWACAKCLSKPRAPYVIWAEGYFVDGYIHACFDAFWDNKEILGEGLQDRYCDMLKYTVRYLSDCNAIMGYDIFNEPFPGKDGGKVFRQLVKRGISTGLFSKRVDRKKIIKDVMGGNIMDALSVADDSVVYHHVIEAGYDIIKKFDIEKYYPFLMKAAAAIRSVKENGVIFAENSYYSNLGIPYSIHVPTDENGERARDFAFAPHGYDITVDTPLTNEASPYRIDHIFNQHEANQERLGLPVLVGEWGGMVDGGEKYPALEHLVDKFDKNKWSNTYWHYFDNFCDSKIGDIICRPLPVAVAGEIKYYRYDRKTKTFDLSYVGSADVKTSTLVYLPAEPQKVYSTKKYNIKDTANGLMLQVYAGKGDCFVKVEF
jgi:endoglycosylceramidase